MIQNPGSDLQIANLIRLSFRLSDFIELKSAKASKRILPRF